MICSLCYYTTKLSRKLNYKLNIHLLFSEYNPHTIKKIPYRNAEENNSSYRYNSKCRFIKCKMNTYTKKKNILLRKLIISLLFFISISKYSTLEFFKISQDKLK